MFDYMFNSSMSQRFDRAPLWFTAPGLEVVDGHGDRGWIDQAFFGPRAGRAWLRIKDVRQMEGPHIRDVVEGILQGVARLPGWNRCFVEAFQRVLLDATLDASSDAHEMS